MDGRFVRPFIWSALPFAAVMTVVELILAGSGLTTALYTGGVSGAMFGAAMGSLNASGWLRDWARRKTDLSLKEDETVQASGFANLEEHGGILYLTNRHLRFTSHPFNYGTTDWVVSLSDITEVQPTRTVGGLVPNGIRVKIGTDQEKQLTTWERDEWCAAIKEHM